MLFRARKLELDARAFGSSPFVVFASSLAFAGLLSTAASAAPYSAPPVFVNGASTVVAQSVQRAGRVFVPAQTVFSRLGIIISYKAPHAVVTTRQGVRVATMMLNSRTASVKGSRVTLPVAPFTAQGQLMVPLRFVSEAAGATVSYKSRPRSVLINRAVAITPTIAVAPNVAQANPELRATDATAAPAAQINAGIPWWVWLLAAILIAGAIFVFMRRRRSTPIIATRGTVRNSLPTISTTGKADDRKPTITTRR